MKLGRSLDRITEFKNVATDKTGKAMENARLIEIRTRKTACNLKRREDPGTREESLETTVQTVDDQQFYFPIQDGERLGYWMLTNMAKYSKKDECAGKRAVFFWALDLFHKTPSLTESLEECEAFVDFFANSPALSEANIITSQLLHNKGSGDQ
ncbi:hypothetical protein ACROYT_G023903 [Oculina patagonica]